MRVGVIGLGIMGSAMAARLMETGHEVTGYDIAGDKLAAAQGTGVTSASSPREVMEQSDLVLLSVTSTAHVADAVFGEDGCATAAKPGAVIVDLSTSEVGRTKEMAQRLRQDAGAEWVDAPVSGGPGAARDGTLAIMAGGEDAAMAAAQPVLATLGHVTHLGPAGAGQATKMVNQILVLTNYCVLAEALRLAERAGVDAAKVPECLASGHAGSNMLATLYPRMLDRAYEPPAGYARQILKDLDMLHDFARDIGTPTPMSDQARTLYRLLVSRGYGELDGTAVLKLYDDDPI